MNQKRIFASCLVSLFFSASLTSASIAHAAPAKTKKAQNTHWAPVITPEQPLLDDAYYNKLVKQTKEARRKLAQAEVDVPTRESKFEKDFLAMRAELIGDETGNKGVKTKEELDALVKKYSDTTRYAGLSPQAKFLALQLRALAPTKSIFFRLKKYVSAYDATRTMVVSMLRAQFAGLQMFYPVGADVSNPVINHWEVVFKYMTEPMDGMEYPIDSDQHLANYLTQLANTMGLINNDFAALVNSGANIWWDNKLYFSFANFTSTKDRYIMLGAPELHSLLAASNLSLSALYATTAYSLDGLQQSVQSIGTLFGIQAQNGFQPQGMSSRSRFKVLNAHPNLFVRVADGKSRMDSAYKLLVAGVRAAKYSYELTAKLPEGTDNLFDPRVALAFNRIATTSFANVDDLLTGEPVSSAVVNGEKIRMSIKNFYDNPPERLSELYPVDWDNGPAEFPVTAWGKPDTLRNFKNGMATAWNFEPYSKLFPDLTAQQKKINGKKITKDIPQFTRVLAQTWGSGAFAIPLGAVIF